MSHSNSSDQLTRLTFSLMCSTDGISLASLLTEISCYAAVIACVLAIWISCYPCRPLHMWLACGAHVAHLPWHFAFKFFCFQLFCLKSNVQLDSWQLPTRPSATLSCISRWFLKT